MANRRRTHVFFFGALALVAALLPAGLVSSAQTTGDSTLVYLTLGSTDRVTWMAETQTFSVRNNCSVTPGGSDILDLTTVGGQLGFVRDGFGVKSTGDGTGEPCGRVEANDGEALSVSLGSELDGYLMSAIDVDLELKFNAMVEVIFKHDNVTVFSVDDPPFSGMGGSDDGPDSGDGDNFRFFARPTVNGNPVLFDEVVFVPVSGAMSLEGGADGTDKSLELDTNSNSSQFEVVQTFDGEIGCTEDTNTATIFDPAVEDVIGVVTMRALDLDASTPEGWDDACTTRKPFNENVTETSLLFSPVLEGSLARYTMILTLDNQPIMTESGVTTSLIMEYNDGFGGGDLTLEPCNAVPQAADYTEDGDNGIVPDSEVHFACYFGVSLTPTSPGFGTEVWQIYFEDDPGFNFR